MDWEGIKLVERLIQLLLVIVAIGSVSYAFVNEYFPYTTFGMIGGFGLASLIAVPDWPCFNRHPIAWQDAIDIKEEKQKFEKKHSKSSKKKNKSNKESSQTAGESNNNNNNNNSNNSNKSKSSNKNKQNNVNKRKTKGQESAP